MLIKTFLLKKSSQLLLSNRIFRFSTSHWNSNGTISKLAMNKNAKNIQYAYKISQSLLTPSINYTFSTQYNQQQRSQSRYQKDPQLYHMNKNIQQLKSQPVIQQKQLIQQMHTFAQQLANKGYIQQAIQVNEQVIKRFQQYYKNRNNQNNSNRPNHQQQQQQQKHQQQQQSRQQQEQRPSQQQLYEQEQGLLSQRILYHRYQKQLYKQQLKQLQQQQQSLVDQQYQQNKKKYIQINNKLIQQSKRLIQISRQQMRKKQNSLVMSMIMLDNQLDVAKLLLRSNQIDQALNLLQQMIAGEENIDLNSITTNKLTYVKARNLYAQILIQYKLSQSSNQQSSSTQQRQQIINKVSNHLNTNLNKLLQPQKQQYKIQSTNYAISQLAHCVMLLSKIHVINIENNNHKQHKQHKQQQLKLFLSKINPSLLKDIHQHYTKNIIKNINQINQLILFYRNTAKLYQHIKDYNNTILCYRQQRQLLKDQQLQQLSNCLFNQTKIYLLLKKQQKAVQKLIKSYELRMKLIGEIQKKKKRKQSQEDKNTLQRNRLILKESVEKIVQVYKKINNNKKVDQWKKVYDQFLTSTKSQS